jgi:hypothetical protein
LKLKPRHPAQIRKELLFLNKPQRGSLGEFIVEHEFLSQGIRIEPIRKQRIDFLIEGDKKIDVKTTFRNIDRAKKKCQI